MNAVDIIASEAVQAGYRDAAIVRDYSFADVLHERDECRTVALAAFTHTPPSYRSAALAVVDATAARTAAELVAENRALGAPLLFLLDGDSITVWQVGMERPPRRLLQTDARGLPGVFAENRDSWHPQAIHRAKSIGGLRSEYQLDFVDAGLLPAIEGEVHSKLDHLLGDALAAAHEGRRRLDKRLLFRATFRFLAAKVLRDRSHPVAAKWDPSDVASVLGEIENYYGLLHVAPDLSTTMASRLAPVWEVISAGIDFRNISSDDLAFVYENTLVTPETRSHFGTHSTPRQVAEYVTDSLSLWNHDLESLRIYEPFAGAGVFLVAALRRLRDLLPTDWDDQKRHAFSVERVFGDELDSFAREVAVLSLILADYPNANGWRIGERDLFVGDSLAKRAKSATVVLCNPPFESFKPKERSQYPEAAKLNHLKAAFVLESVIDAKPNGLGFVLPRPALLGKQWQRARNRIEAQYHEIEFVSLPDRVFEYSAIRSALVIAHTPRIAELPHGTIVRSTTVAERDREGFLRSGKTTSMRLRELPFVRDRKEPLWIPELEELWEYLSNSPTLSDIAEVHRGLEWTYPQREAVSPRRQAGHVRGLAGANSVQQFVAAGLSWMDFREDSVKWSRNWPWKRPKILANAARISRGPWCLAAVVDESGLVSSQQLVGVWVRNDARFELHELCAVLNSPLANAFAAVHSEPDRIRNTVFCRIPIPHALPSTVQELAKRYARAAQECLAQTTPERQYVARRILDELDATVLEAYELPPRLEAALLEHFRETARPTVHAWTHWVPEDLTASFSLREILSTEFRRARSDWPLEIFCPLPEDEARLLREYAE